MLHETAEQTIQAFNNIKNCVALRKRFFTPLLTASLMSLARTSAGLGMRIQAVHHHLVSGMTEPQLLKLQKLLVQAKDSPVKSSTLTKRIVALKPDLDPPEHLEEMIDGNYLSSDLLCSLWSTSNLLGKVYLRQEFSRGGDGPLKHRPTKSTTISPYKLRLDDVPVTASPAEVRRALIGFGSPIYDDICQIELFREGAEEVQPVSKKLTTRMKRYRARELLHKPSNVYAFIHFKSEEMLNRVFSTHSRILGIHLFNRVCFPSIPTSVIYMNKLPTSAYDELGSYSSMKDALHDSLSGLAKDAFGLQIDLVSKRKAAIECMSHEQACSLFRALWGRPVLGQIPMLGFLGKDEVNKVSFTPNEVTTEVSS